MHIAKIEDQLVTGLVLSWLRQMLISLLCCFTGKRVKIQSRKCSLMKRVRYCFEESVHHSMPYHTIVTRSFLYWWDCLLFVIILMAICLTVVLISNTHKTPPLELSHVTPNP